MKTTPADTTSPTLAGASIAPRRDTIRTASPSAIPRRLASCRLTDTKTDGAASWSAGGFSGLRARVPVIDLTAADGDQWKLLVGEVRRRFIVGRDQHRPTIRVPLVAVLLDRVLMPGLEVLF